MNVVNAQQLKKADIYITPRNVSYGWCDNGVFQHELKRMSLLVPYKDRTYRTIAVKDSVYELVYKKIIFPDSLYKELKAIEGVKECNRRILIVTHKNDSVFVDSNFNVVVKNKCFMISEKLKSFLESLMPIEMKENWEYNLPGY